MYTYMYLCLNVMNNATHNNKIEWTQEETLEKALLEAAQQYKLPKHSPSTMCLDQTFCPGQGHLPTGSFAIAVCHWSLPEYDYDSHLM